MQWQFPEIKTTRTIDERVQKVIDELKEFSDETNPIKKDIEAIDVLHAVETLLRLQFKGREEKLKLIINLIIEKNEARGYYTKACF